jgi:hypothetical protein
MPLSATLTNHAPASGCLSLAFGPRLAAGTTCQFITQLGATATWTKFSEVFGLFLAGTFGRRGKALIISSRPSLPDFPRKAFFSFFFFSFSLFWPPSSKNRPFAILCCPFASFFLSFLPCLFSRLDKASFAPSPRPSTPPSFSRLISHRLQNIPRPTSSPLFLFPPHTPLTHNIMLAIRAAAGPARRQCFRAAPRVAVSISMQVRPHQVPV